MLLIRKQKSSFGYCWAHNATNAGNREEQEFMARRVHREIHSTFVGEKSLVQLQNLQQVLLFAS